ncbi:MAG: protease pro-enzyme activation domain-containing protein [Bryobacteraceae bacterium]
MIVKKAGKECVSQAAPRTSFAPSGLLRVIFPLCLCLQVCPNLLAQRPRILDKFDENRRSTIHGNVHPKALPQYDRGPVEPSLKLGYISLSLKKSKDQQADLDRLLQQQQDLASPLFHKWLTPEEYADRFGLNPDDTGKIADWLQSSGFTIIQVARGRDFIAFSGTAREVDRAFRTSIHSYLVDGTKHYANATAPSVPEAFSNVVSGIRGLDDFIPKAPKRAQPLAPNFISQRLGENVLAPDDLAAIYDIVPLYQNGFDGTGQTLVVAGQTNIDLTDIRAFRQSFNLPPNEPQLVLVAGSPDPGILSDQLGEADLDLEWSGAIARNAKIVFVYSKDVSVSVQYAIDNNLAPVITLSYGGCEALQTPVVAGWQEDLAQKANSEGITWIASSGDSGAAGCEKDAGPETSATTGLSVVLPASLPEVTGVGGTEFSDWGGGYYNGAPGPNLGTAFSYIPETSWNDSILLPARRSRCSVHRIRRPSSLPNNKRRAAPCGWGNLRGGAGVCRNRRSAKPISCHGRLGQYQPEPLCPGAKCPYCSSRCHNRQQHRLVSDGHTELFQRNVWIHRRSGLRPGDRVGIGRCDEPPCQLAHAIASADNRTFIRHASCERRKDQRKPDRL